MKISDNKKDSYIQKYQSVIKIHELQYIRENKRFRLCNISRHAKDSSGVIYQKKSRDSGQIIYHKTQKIHL